MIGASFLRHSYVQDALEQVMQGILRTKKLYYIYIYLIRLLVKDAPLLPAYDSLFYLVIIPRTYNKMPTHYQLLNGREYS